MKKRLKNFLYLSTLITLFASCKKDLDVLRLDTTIANAPKLTATESNLVLLEAREANTAIVFNWTKPMYNFSGAFKYILQFAKAGTNFANPINEGSGTDLSKAFTEKAFNALILSLGIQPGTAGNVEVRLKADLNDSVPSLYSNIRSLVVTPYTTDQILYVPGGYQGWDPAAAEIIRSINKNKKFEGYIYFSGPNNEFKFTDAPNWNNGIFGDESGGTSGNIKSPGDNFKVATAGYHKINADLNANTWTVTKTDWGLIGSATAGGWGSDQNLTYDPATKKWTITADLVAGEIKFRANDDWGINFGDDGANGSMEYGGANIGISSDGNYTITLNLSEAGKYTYTVKKN